MSKKEKNKIIKSIATVQPVNIIGGTIEEISNFLSVNIRRLKNRNQQSVINFVIISENEDGELVEKTEKYFYSKTACTQQEEGMIYVSDFQHIIGTIVQQLTENYGLDNIRWNEIIIEVKTLSQLLKISYVDEL